MAQLFLNGWIVADPGPGEMTFALPEGADNAVIVGLPRDPDLADLLTVTGSIVVINDSVTGEPKEYIARIAWVNSHDAAIDFDYKITPYSGPEPPAPGGLWGLGGL